LLEQIGQIGRRAERPFARHPHQIDAAAGIKALELFQERGQLLAEPETLAEARFVQWLSGGEQQGLQHAQLLPPVGRRQGRDVVREPGGRSGARFFCSPLLIRFSRLGTRQVCAGLAVLGTLNH